MAEPVKRIYRSEVRATAAAATRASIRDAAAVLFSDQGYVATTMHEIAGRAEVSVRTVFNAYPDGKAQIFDEALDFALGGDERRQPLASRPVTRDVVEEADTRRLVEGLVDGAAEIYERAGPLITTYMQSSGADPHMRHHADLGELEARKIMRQVARALEDRGALRADLSVRHAGDALLVLCSPESHRVLRRACGWSRARYRAWLIRQIGATILREPLDHLGEIS